jgi:hypothetical protein
MARMITVFNDVGGLPIVFVRYNPDAYHDHNGKHVKTKTGREKRLISTIKSCLQHEPTTLLSCVYLYYDGDDGKNKMIDINIDEEVKRLNS